MKTVNRSAWGRAAGLREKHRIAYERWIKGGKPEPGDLLQTMLDRIKKDSK
jgi:hypothetical protein